MPFIKPQLRLYPFNVIKFENLRSTNNYIHTQTVQQHPAIWHIRTGTDLPRIEQLLQAANIRYFFK